MSSNQLNNKLMMLVSNGNSHFNSQITSANIQAFEQRNKSTEKMREQPNLRGDIYQNQLVSPFQNSISNKSNQRQRNASSGNKNQNRSNQNSQQAIQFNHTRANSHNDMQHARKTVNSNAMQNYSSKNPTVLDSQVFNIQQRNEFQDDIKRVMNGQINTNLGQTSNGLVNGQKNIKKTYQQIKGNMQISNNNSMNANGSNATQTNQQMQQQNMSNQYQQQQHNHSQKGQQNQNNILSLLSEYANQSQQNSQNQQINNNNGNSFLAINNSQGQENAINVDAKNNQKAQINSSVDLNDMKKSLSDIKLPKLSSQLKKQLKPGVIPSEQPRSQSTQPQREQYQNASKNKNNETQNGNIVMQTEASALQNESVGSSQILNKISQTYDIQQKMITDIENIDYQNGKVYGYQKQAQQQMMTHQLNGDILQNNQKRATQSAIYKQLQQSKYNNRQAENNSQTHQNILKQSFQISLPVKMQIEKQLQQQKQSSTLQANENRNGKTNEVNEEKQNTIEIVGLNQQQKQLIQKNKSNLVAQSVDTNFKNYLKNSKKKNITPDPIRMSVDSIYTNINAAKIQSENENIDAKTLQSTLNQFRVRSQTPNSNIRSTNQNQPTNTKKTHTPISSSYQQNDFNSAMNNASNMANQNTNEYINQNNQKQSKQQTNSNIQYNQYSYTNNQTMNQINNQQMQQQQQKQQQQSNQYQQQQQQFSQQQYQQEQQQQPIQQINNYEYNLNFNSIPDNQNFRHKTPIKLKLNNNSLIKIQKVPITDQKEYLENQNLKNSKLASQANNNSSNFQNANDKSSSRQSDSTNEDVSGSKSKLQKNNFIAEPVDNQNQQGQENNGLQRNSQINQNKFQINLQKTPDQQQQRKGQVISLQQYSQQQQFQQIQKQTLQNILNKKFDNTTQIKNPIRKYQHKTKAGCNYNGPKTNQDNFIIYTNLNNKQDRYIFAVCDGHGVYGHLCSSFIRRILPKKIEEALAREINNLENDFIENSLNLAFLQCSKELLESNIDCTFSGSTCVLLLIIGNKMWSANAGDSRAIICSSHEKLNWDLKPLTRDHKPDDPEEYKRIIQRGGRVETYRDEYNNPLGPYRVWLRDENIPGLAMARSFGDVIASQVGVTCEPEVISFDIQESDRFIILASDGVWEFISNEDVMNHVIPYYKLDDTEQGCQKLVKESTTQWKLNDEVVDDITCILIFLS
ncbi:hypothetical protein ABPG72_019409 [Tetrahymena utriculariae]